MEHLGSSSLVDYEIFMDMFSTRRSLPEEKLCTSMLWHGVHDLLNEDMNPEYYKSAKLWFFSEQPNPSKPEPFSFLFVCEVLGINPRWFLKKLRSIAGKKLTIPGHVFSNAH